MRFAVLGALAGLLWLAPQPPPFGASVTATAAWRVVSTQRLLQAMEEVRAYELTATANGARLQADVVLALVHEAHAVDPERRPLFIGHREWYEAFLARTSLPPSKAPLYVQRPYEVGQDLVVDYRREAVVEAVLGGAGAPGGRERPDLLAAGAREARRVLLRRHALGPRTSA